MSSLFDDATSTGKSESLDSATDFFNKNGILIVIVIILFFTIIAIWLIGSKVGDTIFDGVKVPSGFPFYVVRNLFNTFSLILIGLAIFYVIRTIQDFDGTILVLLFTIFCGTIISYEALLEQKKDFSGAALISTLSLTCLAFLIFLSWRSNSWVKFLVFISGIWYIFIFFETLTLHYING